MRKESLITLSVIVAILFIAGGIIFIKNFQGSTIKDFPSEQVAKWIGEHSVVYVQAGCSHCIDQENLFGSNWKYINSVDYSSNPEAFVENNITGTPTWVINGVHYEGVQSIEKLKELTGYSN
jgi:glutaredoxin